MEKRNISSIGFPLILLSALIFMGCNSQPERTFWSPYADVNWSGIGHYDSEFHTHPGLGDEDYDPHQTIDRYHEEGYQILALAGHDRDVPTDYISTIYPWTQLADIYELIKDVENPHEKKLYRAMASEPYQNRDPIALNMISVQGCEITTPHDIVSLFNPICYPSENEDKCLELISEHGGLAYFAHPQRYVQRWGLTADWYVDMYRRHDVLLGQAIYNRQDRHPEDRPFFDKIAHMLGHERPIWLYGEDDMHYESTLGWNRDVILLENFRPGSMHPDIDNGSAPDVYRALKNGHSYLWKPSQQYNRRAFNITDVQMKKTNISIRVDHPGQVKEIRWMTHNPETDQTEAIHTGESISMTEIPDYSRFVRAEIQGEKGTIYTQPFYVVPRGNAFRVNR